MSAQSHVAIRNLTFSYEASPTPIFQEVTLNFPPGFTGIIGPNGSGKTTLLRLLVGELVADSGDVEGTDNAVYCEQRTDSAPVLLDEFLQDWEGEAASLRSRFGIEWDFLERWHTLSHGERKRTQVATALWRRPQVLTIDEPTNHIDRVARNVLLENLKKFEGVGLLISHDRDLLDDLCHQCVWIDPPAARMYSGGYSSAREQRSALRESTLKERAKAKQSVRRLHAESASRRETAASEPQRRSKRGLAPKDNDGRGRINKAINTDGKSGNTLRQLDGRIAQAEARLEQSVVQKEFETGIWLDDSRSRRSYILEMPAAGVELDESRRLTWPDLTVGVSARIAVTGPNGSGKSTFIDRLLPKINAPPEHIIYLPQEISEQDCASALVNVLRLPDDQLGKLMTIVSRLGSRPGRLIDSKLPSPGETRKLLLALGMLKLPHAIIMDEPTNHLDVLSIEALEQALADCPCAIILVSHDEAFIGALDMQRWQISEHEAGESVLAPT